MAGATALVEEAPSCRLLRISPFRKRLHPQARDLESYTYRRIPADSDNSRETRRVMAAPPDTDIWNRSFEERLSRLEGGFEHLATKADVERVLIEVQRILVAVERNRTEIERNRMEIARLNAETERNRTEIERLRVEVERNRTEVERVRADVTKLIVKVAGVGVGLLAAGFAFLRFTGTG